MTDFINSTPPRGALNKQGRAFFNRHFKRGVMDGIVKESDFDAFIELCYLHGQVQELRQKIKSEGDVIEDRDKNQRKNPAIPRLKDVEAKFLRLSNRFGLNPAARRARTRVAEPLVQLNALDLFRKAQRWVDDTFQNRRFGLDVPIPEDVAEYFGWRQGEKTVFSKAEMEELKEAAKDDAKDDAARELLADVDIDGRL